jgi:hypothetical protein
MSVSQSNLSDPRYGFDLVVAVTQRSINTTLKLLLDGLTDPEVTICYVYDDSNNLVPIDYETLKTNAHGSDPFQVPDGANPATNQDLKNLRDANFAGGVKAMLGLPDVASPPAIATLVADANTAADANAPVLFNLLCAEFQITGFDYGPHTTWTNASQPSGGPAWYFSANVKLNSTAITPDAEVPKAVQQRISDLQHQVQNAFTIQKLFLDLDTAVPESSPTIQGPLAGSALWQLIEKVFMGAYFKQLRQKGDPVLSYSFTVDAPRPTTLELGSVSRECCPLLDASGHPITSPPPAQQNAATPAQDATTLVYIGTQSRTPPVPVPFSWNWMESKEVREFSGVQSVRRDVFLTYLAGLINANVPSLCLTTNVNAKQDSDRVNAVIITWDYPHRSSAPQYFRRITPIGGPGADGFTEILSLAYESLASADQRSKDGGTEFWTHYNYNLGGTVAVKGNQIRIKVEATLYLSVSHYEEIVLGPYNDLVGANYYDKTLTVLYTLGVDQDGVLQVTQTQPNLADNSAPWNWTARGLSGALGYEQDLQAKLTSFDQLLAGSLDSAITGYATDMKNTINGYRAWVFAGNDAFVFKDVSFSQGLDLIAQLTYVNPS